MKTTTTTTTILPVLETLVRHTPGGDGILPAETVLILHVDGLDHHGDDARWPGQGFVEGDLRGLLWGEAGEEEPAMLATTEAWDSGARWLVVEALDEEVSEPDPSGWVKFGRGVVVHAGDRVSAAAYVEERGSQYGDVIGSTVLAGDGGAAVAGGFRGTAIGGDRSMARAGTRGTAVVGVRGLAAAGEAGTAIAGDGGMAIVGPYGHAIAGDRGRAAGGEGAMLSIAHSDGERYRVAVAYVGENGIDVGVAYKLDSSTPPRFVPAKLSAAEVVARITRRQQRHGVQPLGRRRAAATA